MQEIVFKLLSTQQSLNENLLNNLAKNCIIQGSTSCCESCSLHWIRNIYSLFLLSKTEAAGKRKKTPGFGTPCTFYADFWSTEKSLRWPGESVKPFPNVNLIAEFIPQIDPGRRASRLGRRVRIFLAGSLNLILDGGESYGRILKPEGHTVVDCQCGFIFYPT